MRSSGISGYFTKKKKTRVIFSNSGFGCRFIFRDTNPGAYFKILKKGKMKRLSAGVRTGAGV